MGGGNSKQTEIDVIQSSINETINRAMTETNNSAECQSEIEQTMILNLDNVTMTGKSNFQAGQTTKVNMSCFTENVNEIATNIQKELENMLGSEASIEEYLESSGIGGGSNESELVKSIQQYVENRVVNESESVINNSISVDQSASNTMIFNLGSLSMADEASFTVSQEGFIDVIGESIAKNMVDTIISENNITIIEDETDADTTAIKTGWDIGTVSLYIVVGSAVVAAIGLIGIAIFGIFFAKSSEKIITNPNTGANLKEIGSVGAMFHPATSTAAMASKVIQGGAKKLMNKTSLQSLILFILFLIAYKLT